MTPTISTTRTRTPSTLAREYEEEDQHSKLSQQLQAAMMVGTLFCYVSATSLVLLAAIVLAPFLPVSRAFKAVLAASADSSSSSSVGGISSVRSASSVSSVSSAILSTVSSYAASAPAPAEVLPIGKSLASVIYNDRVFVQETGSYIVE